jgi:hypothetical protein
MDISEKTKTGTGLQIKKGWQFTAKQLITQNIKFLNNLSSGSVIIDDFSQRKLEAVALHHPHLKGVCADLSILI